MEDSDLSPKPSPREEKNFKEQKIQFHKHSWGFAGKMQIRNFQVPTAYVHTGWNIFFHVPTGLSLLNLSQI